MTDIDASILAKLKNKARTSGIAYQQCLQLFFQEEFLRRLAKSSYADNLILKGGLFIYALTNFESRATVDIDFLLRCMDHDMVRIAAMIEAILAVKTSNDSVKFKTGKVVPIALQQEYHGVSVQIIGSIKNVRVPFNVDIGVGDVIVPKPVKRTINTQLAGFEAPEIYTYSIESTIAEKFDAILQRFELTSRMKDFYDIYYLAHSFDFEGRVLQEAIAQTLQNRGTHVESGSLARIIQLAEDKDIQVRWRHFLKILMQPELPFESVLDTINIFLQPVFEAIVKQHVYTKMWDNAKLLWQ
jgi:predicted nucleotidyltransferase component of viral defense system